MYCVKHCALDISGAIIFFYHYLYSYGDWLDILRPWKERTSPRPEASSGSGRTKECILGTFAALDVNESRSR